MKLLLLESGQDRDGDEDAEMKLLLKISRKTTFYFSAVETALFDSNLQKTNSTLLNLLFEIIS